MFENGFIESSRSLDKLQEFKNEFSSSTKRYYEYI